jgi:predicted nucleotidyltransferase
VLHGTDWMAATSTCWSMRARCHVVGLGRFGRRTKSLLGVDVDLLTPGDLPPKFRAKVLAEAQPI